MYMHTVNGTVEEYSVNKSTNVLLLYCFRMKDSALIFVLMIYSSVKTYRFEFGEGQIVAF